MRTCSRSLPRATTALAFLLWAAGGLLRGGSGNAEKAPLAYRWVPAESTVEIHVPKAGIFSALGHAHTIRVGDFEGQLVGDPAVPPATAITFSVPVASLEVSDEELSLEDRAEVRQTMLSPRLLEAERFEVIQFVSRAVEAKADGLWRVVGQLTIAGRTADLSFSATVEIDDAEAGRVRARGAVAVALADFGLRPISALGGTIRTGKVVELRFDLIGQRAPSPPPL